MPNVGAFGIFNIVFATLVTALVERFLRGAMALNNILYWDLRG
jgi:hypothetical protein